MKPLSEFSEEEWEVVCMRCSKCCLTKRYDGNKTYFTNMICRNFSLADGKCNCYASRISGSCAKVSLKFIEKCGYELPATCAYRLLYEGKDLPDWHPLVSGDENSAHIAGKTVMEMPQVFSGALLSNALQELGHISWVEKWPEEQFEREEGRIFAKYNPIILEEHPVPDWIKSPNDSE